TWSCTPSRSNCPSSRWSRHPNCRNRSAVRLLGRYVFREILTSAVLGTLLSTFVIFLNGSKDLFGLLVGAGNPGIKTIVMLFALAMPPVLPTTIPFGVLVGILIGLGRMARDRKSTRLNSSH